MSKQRFYEKDPVVKQAVEVIRLFPRDFQAIIANGMATIAERNYGVKDQLKDLKSLGSEKVLALFKSKAKKRDYDQIPEFHQAMNYLMVMDPEDRNLISKQVLEMVTFIQEYIKTCKTHVSTPTTFDIKKLTEIYVKLGPDESKRFVKAVDAEFNRLMFQLKTPEGASLQEERLQAAEGEMWIKGRSLNSGAGQNR